MNSVEAVDHEASPPLVTIPTPLERSLRLFTDVHPGEGFTALVMFANVFLILTAYYFLKPLRDGWIAVSDVRGLSTIEVKAYTSFAQGLVLIFAVAFYARLVTWWPRRELITRTTAFCILNLVLFWGLYRMETAGMGVIFYIWVGVFGVFVVSQFWAFAADLYTDERGRRLLPLIAIGATAGAVVGSFLTELIVHSGVFDSGALLLVATLPLLASIALTRIADRHGPTAAAVMPESARDVAVPPAQCEEERGGALRLVYHHRYLLAVAAVSLLTNWVSTNGDNLLFRVVQEALKNQAGPATMEAPFVREGTTAFYGSFFFWVNLCALLLQAFFASRLLAYGGFGVTLMLLPVIALSSYAAMAFVPILAVVQVMKTAENSTSYSINNTAKQVLWLPTTTEMKYTAKPVIETFFVRVGDGLAAFTVLIGMRWYALSLQVLFLFNVFLTLLWIVGAVVVVREYQRLRTHPTA